MKRSPHDIVLHNVPIAEYVVAVDPFTRVHADLFLWALRSPVNLKSIFASDDKHVEISVACTVFCRELKT